MSISRYHFFLSDYLDDQNRSMGSLYLGDCDESATMSSIRLLSYAQNFERTWGKLLAPRPNVEIEMRVYGSEFARRFFRAYANKRNSESFRYIDNATSVPPRAIIERSFAERLQVLSEAFTSNDVALKMPSEVVLRFDESVEDVDRIVQSLNEFSEYLGILPVTYKLKKISSDEDSSCGEEEFVISLVSSSEDSNICWESLSPTENIVFKYNPYAPENDVLDPRQCAKDDNRLHYCWKFNRLEDLVEAIKIYVEGHLLARKLVRARNEFLFDYSDKIDFDTFKKVWGCTKVFPYAIVEAPEACLVGEDFSIRVHGVKIDPRDLPIPDFVGFGENPKEETIRSEDGTLVTYRYGTKTPGAWRFSVRRSDGGLGAPSGWFSDIVIARTMKGVQVVEPDEFDSQSLVAGVTVRNHNQTTRFDFGVCRDDGSFKDQGNAEYAVGDVILFGVVASNRFDSNLIPDDADDWCYDIRDPGGIAHVVEERFANGRKGLRIVTQAHGDVSITVFWPNREMSRSMAFRILPHLERIECRVAAVDEESGLKPRISADVDGKITVRCFCNQKMSIYAKGCGAAEQLYIPTISMQWDGDGSPYKTDVINQKVCFKSPQNKTLVIRSTDPQVAKSCRIDFIVSEDKSDLMRNVMCGLLLAAFVNFFSFYGLGLLMLLVYLAPIFVYCHYRRRKYLLHGKLLKVILAIDIVLLIWSFLQEIS